MADLPYIQQAQEVKITGQSSSGGTVNYVGADANGNMTVKDYATSATGSAVPSNSIFVGGKNPSGNLQGFLTDSSGRLYVDLFDGSGNSISSINSQLETRDVINVSSQYRAQSVTTTAAEATGGTSRLTNRKFISITPTNGTIYWGTSSSVTTVTGSPIFANNTLFLSFTDNVPVYIISAGTVDVRILEAS